ncbi:hypothetical protein DL93DRAFT_2227649 [Clavulina sp. PMI_390]|nr:hypothetical protein DL93DRAFT_2227649 [Clavulina sp. PMI_390]
MSIGEVEDMLEREQKRKDERRRKKIKQLQKQDARGTGSARFMSAIVPGSLTRRQRSATAQTITNGSASIHSSENSRNHESIELSVMGSTHTTNNAAQGDELDDSPSVVAVPTALTYIPLAPTLYTSALRGWRSLTRAHRDEVINVAMSRPAQAQEGTGWGLGDYGLREREEAEQRIRDFQAERRRRMLLGEDSSLAEQDEVERDIAAGDDDDDDDDEIGRGFFYPPPPPAFHSASGAPSPHSSIPLQPMPGPSEERAESEATDDPLPHPLPPNDSLFWRWGPLRKWRLQDRTTY